MAQIIDMPKLSDTMTVGTLVKWKKKEGDAVKNGDMLAEVETDKATMELESFFDGTLLKIFAPEGSQIPIGAALCAIGKVGETVEAQAPLPAAASANPQGIKTGAHVAPGTQVSSETPALPAPATPSPSQSVSSGRIGISPLARKIAAAKGIDFSSIQGSGPGGRIVRADIMTAAGSAVPAKTGGMKASSPESSVSLFSKDRIQEERVTAVSNMRGTIARRLLESKTQIPHFYVEMEIDAAPLALLRQQLNAALEKDGVKLSINDFILKASAEAMRRVPTVNASWEGTQVRFFSAAHVAFAVAIDDGLITPVIHDAHLKTLFQISSEAKQLAKLAKEKKLQPAQYTGGTFCVSNLGMMGVDRFSAIINPPNAAILAVGGILEKPVASDGRIEIGQRMVLTLSCDHRVVDGAMGAQYLGALKQLLEAPSLLLV
ncbi:MAG: pyruvate dehydrogenase complex dihydrolipoamide acetyltransferase [Opitutaceae bacterium]|jgi:pyruvate dehydrogenase E2 component (dihydrolipoamide acetyltransferase)